jgi:hypothetical protein
MLLSSCMQAAAKAAADAAADAAASPLALRTLALVVLEGLDMSIADTTHLYRT